MAAAMQISARAASRCSRTIIARLPTGLDVFDTSLAGIPSSTRTLKTAAEDTTVRPTEALDANPAQPQAAAGGQSEVKVEESHRVRPAGLRPWLTISSTPIALRATRPPMATAHRRPTSTPFASAMSSTT